MGGFFGGGGVTGMTASSTNLSWATGSVTPLELAGPHPFAFIGDTGFDDNGFGVRVSNGAKSIDFYWDANANRGGVIQDGGGPTGKFVTLGDVDFSNNGTIIKIRDNAQAVIQTAPPSTTSAVVGNSQISFWLDEVGNKLTVAAKYSNGTAKTGTVNLT